MFRGKFACFSCSDKKHFFHGEVREYLLRQFDRCIADRYGTFHDFGSGLDFFGDAEGCMAEPCEQNACCLHFGSNAVCLFYLTENLPFSQDERIYGAGYFKKVTGCAAIEAAEEVFRANIFSCFTERDDIVLEIFAGNFMHCRNNIDFCPVAC